MSRNSRASVLAFLSIATIALGFAVPSFAIEKTAVSDDVLEPGRSGGIFSYTLVPVTPFIQSAPNLFVGPYFDFELTNTGPTDDTYHLEINNLDQPTWVPQVCIGLLCFPDSTDQTVNPQETITCGVNIVPFSDGVGNADFRLYSIGDPGLESNYSVTLYAGTAATSVEVYSHEAGHVVLSQSFPNPARGATTIDFVLPSERDVTLEVYDVTGRMIRTLVSGRLPAGDHSATWRGLSDAGAGVPSGVYYYRLSTPEGVQSRKLTYLR